MKRTLAAAAASLLVGPLVVGSAAVAQAATAPGPVVSLPFSTTSAAGPATGGSGSTALDEAVSQRCNAGAPLAGQSWFTLPAGDLGQVLVRGQRLYTDGTGRGQSAFDTRLAVVDHVDGTVLGCGGGPVSITAAHAAAFVVYVDRAELDACAADPECTPGAVQAYASRTTGVPVNDSWTTPQTISSAPSVVAADSGLADGDGPVLFDADCPGSAIDPQQTGTLWWRYTPAVSGEVPLELDVARFGAPGDEPVFAGTAGMLRVTDAGPVRVVRPLDEDGCETGPFPVEAGASYLVGVAQVHDSYDAGSPLVTGGPFTLRIGAPVASAPASAPTSVTVVRDDAARTATVRWAPPASDGGAAVSGYRVARDGADSGGAGAYSTVVAATARSFTFSHLNAWDTYALTVQAVSAVGTGPAAEVTVRLSAATPSAPTGPTVRRGNASATVTWAAPAFSGTSAVTGYRIRRFAGTSGTVQATTTVPASARSATLTGLRNGTAYSFDITAVNAGGLGRPSVRSAAVTPATTPGAPVIATASSGTSGGTATATAAWSAPTSTGGTAVTGYRVTALRMSSTGAVLGTTVSAVQPASARKLAMSLPQAGSYRFTVAAVNAVGTGAASARSNLVTGR